MSPSGKLRDLSSQEKKSGITVGGRKLFTAKNPGAFGRLGKSSTKAESLSKLRGKGAL